MCCGGAHSEETTVSLVRVERLVRGLCVSVRMCFACASEETLQRAARPYTKLVQLHEDILFHRLLAYASDAMSGQPRGLD